MDSAGLDRTALIGKALRPATYTVSEIDVDDFLGVLPEPEFPSSRAAGRPVLKASLQKQAPPSFAPLVAVLGLLRTFDWQEDFWFDYRTGTAMFGEQFLEFHRPLLVGETVHVDASISDVYEKTGKRVFDVVEVTFSISGERDGEPVMSGRQSYILFK
jgi:hypothetical protein